MGNKQNIFAPSRVINQNNMYIVQICDEEARKKHVLNEYFNSMKAGHHNDVIICTNSSAINSGIFSGIDIIAANIIRCDKRHIGKR